LLNFSDLLRKDQCIISSFIKEIKFNVFVVTEEARLALEQLLQQKGEAEDGRLLLKSVYLLSQTDLVKEITTKVFLLFCPVLIFFLFVSETLGSHLNSGTPKSHNVCVIFNALCFSMPRVYSQLEDTPPGL